MIGVTKKKKAMVNIRKTSVTLNELMAFKEKYHYTKMKAQRNAYRIRCTLLSH